MFGTRAETRRRNSWMTPQSRKTERRNIAKGADQLAMCENRMTLIRGLGNCKYGEIWKTSCELDNSDVGGDDVWVY